VKGKKMSKGKLYIISGPSGSGKSTLLTDVLKKLENNYFSVSATTRSPRHGETHGVEYIFMTHENFNTMLENGQFLEYAKYAGNYYGTPIEPIIKQLELGKDIFLDIEVQGALQVRKKMPEAILIFAIPPSFDELEKRLRKRSTETEDKIRERLDTARLEYEKASEYNYIVITDKPGAAANEIIAIVTAEKCKFEERKYLVEEM
jgi:guanylate kinase